MSSDLTEREKIVLKDLALHSSVVNLGIYAFVFGLLSYSHGLWAQNKGLFAGLTLLLVLLGAVRYVAGILVCKNGAKVWSGRVLVWGTVVQGATWTLALGLASYFNPYAPQNLIYFCCQCTASALACLVMMNHRPLIVTYILQSMFGNLVTGLWISQSPMHEASICALAAHLYALVFSLRRHELYTNALVGRLELQKTREAERALFEKEAAQRLLLESRHKELVESRRIAEQASMAKGEFLATMSHEIRTPMNAIFGLSEMLLETSLNRQQREWTETIRGSCDALLTVINDILDFSKIESGKLELNLKSVDPRKVMHEALSVVSKSAELKGLELKSEFDGSIPEAVESDAGRLRQILLNLLSNAIKFTKSGSVTLNATYSDSMLRCSVKDSGIGIAPEKMHRLFKSFSQVDGSTTRTHGGTGLGLVISQRLCAKLGGQVWAESHGALAGDPPSDYQACHQGPGSTFHFMIRAVAVRAEVSHDANVSFDFSELKGLPVLVVEDNPVNQKVLIQMLTRYEVCPQAVSGGIDALELLGKESFPLIFMDIQMPGMDGYATTVAARQLENGRSAWITAITANAFAEDKEACLRYGMNDYLSKPLRQNELAQALQRYLSELKKKSTVAG